MKYILDSISYTVRVHARAKTMTLSVHADGGVAVTIPRRTPKRLAHAFIKSRKAWIEEALEQIEKKREKHRTESSVVFPEYTAAARKKARAVIQDRIHELNDRYFAHTIGRLSIRNTRSRWGSCSAEGNMSFNYKVAFLPAPLRDYVIIHELSHIKHMNHSKRFWELVSTADPEYAVHRKQLKQYTIV